MTATHPRSRTLFRTAALFTFLAVTMGSVVCATDSGFECSTWPGCYTEQFGPDAGAATSWLYKNPVIEFIHRSSAILAGPLVLAAAIVGTRLRGAHGVLVKILPWIAFAGAVAAGAFGRAVVLTGIPTWAGAIDLVCALAAMGCMATAAVAVGREPVSWRPGPAGTWAWLSVAILVVMHMLGLFVAGPSSFTRCMSWPVFSLIATDLSPALQIVRMVLAAGAVAAIVASARAAWRQADLRRHGVASLALLALVLALGVALLFTHQVRELGPLYSIVTVALLFSQVVLGARSSVTTRVAPRRTLEPAGR